MSEDLSVFTLNAHRNWGLVETLLAQRTHGIYLFQEIPYTDKLRRVPSADPHLPLGAWQGGAPCNVAFLDFVHNGHRVATYISSTIKYAFTYAEFGQDIQLIKCIDPDTRATALTIINVYLDHSTTKLEHLALALAQCQHPIIMAGDFNMPSNHWDESHPTRHPQGDTLLDICFEHNLTLINRNGKHTWQQANCSLLLDLIFISGHLAESTPFYEGNFLEASDHRPLWLQHRSKPYAKYCALIPNSPEEDLYCSLIQCTWAEVALLPPTAIPEGFDKSFDKLNTLW
ncbi:hypothetical protein AX15_005955 [Amanita polypyramis BW_CC]|nr:hypothetical protein AX15_005955 [Amanita polypyramis BW_CC]